MGEMLFVLFDSISKVKRMEKEFVYWQIFIKPEIFFFAFFFSLRSILFVLCLRIEADYTLDDSFWNEDSPVGEWRNNTLKYYFRVKIEKLLVEIHIKFYLQKLSIIS